MGLGGDSDRARLEGCKESGRDGDRLVCRSGAFVLNTGRENRGRQALPQTPSVSVESRLRQGIGLDLTRPTSTSFGIGLRLEWIRSKSVGLSCVRPGLIGLD